MAAPVFGYWDVRGRGESIRLLLHYTGTDFIDKRYHLPDDLKSEHWSKDKFTLGMDLPNLPYWIEGDLKLTQSLAILRHLARKNGLVDGATEERHSICEMFEQQCVDFYEEMRNLVLSPKFEEEYKVYARNLPGKLKLFSVYMDDNPWLLGKNLTYVDFQLFETLDRLKDLVPGCLEAFVNLKNFVARFEALPNIARYRQSKEFSKWPFFGPLAKFGGSRQPSVIKS